MKHSLLTYHLSETESRNPPPPPRSRQLQGPHGPDRCPARAAADEADSGNNNNKFQVFLWCSLSSECYASTLCVGVGINVVPASVGTRPVC